MSVRMISNVIEYSPQRGPHLLCEILIADSIAPASAPGIRGVPQRGCAFTTGLRPSHAPLTHRRECRLDAILFEMETST